MNGEPRNDDRVVHVRDAVVEPGPQCADVSGYGVRCSYDAGHTADHYFKHPPQLIDRWLREQLAAAVARAEAAERENAAREQVQARLIAERDAAERELGELTEAARNHIARKGIDDGALLRTLAGVATPPSEGEAPAGTCIHCGSPAEHHDAAWVLGGSYVASLPETLTQSTNPDARESLGEALRLEPWQSDAIEAEIARLL
ncbi:MAG TPA: hypothetical protein VK509_10215, partial [Polyangiales bacterium]|nr:hypothetical protein [Polyangiales bacterium]